MIGSLLNHKKGLLLNLKWGRGGDRCQPFSSAPSVHRRFSFLRGRVVDLREEEDRSSSAPSRGEPDHCQPPKPKSSCDATQATPLDRDRPRRKDSPTTSLLLQLQKAGPLTRARFAVSRVGADMEVDGDELVMNPMEGQAGGSAGKQDLEVIRFAQRLAGGEKAARDMALKQLKVSRP
jgi:hypothetical protein